MTWPNYEKEKKSSLAKKKILYDRLQETIL